MNGLRELWYEVIASGPLVFVDNCDTVGLDVPWHNYVVLPSSERVSNYHWTVVGNAVRRGNNERFRLAGVSG